jgi:DNA-binding NtrC family response regulator
MIGGLYGCEIHIVCGQIIVVGNHKVPSIILLLDHEDANTVVSGVLDFKGCKVYKSRTVDDCLSTLNRLEKGIDVVLVKKELAIDKNFMLVSNIRKISPGTMIIIMADFINEDEKVIENGVDEVVLTPMSAENLGDKILMLIAKKELKEIKEKNG